MRVGCFQDNISINHLFKGSGKHSIALIDIRYSEVLKACMYKMCSNTMIARQCQYVIQASFIYWFYLSYFETFEKKVEDLSRLPIFVIVNSN